jgi:signal transduction histidine kinase/CheY-like chemotaxis protein
MIIQSSQAEAVKPLSSVVKAQTEGIFEQIPLPACMVDLTNRQIIRTNPAFDIFLEVYDLTVEEIPLPYSTLAAGSLLVSEEFSITSYANRQITFLLTSGEPLEADDGHYIHVIYLNDVTYMKKIEADRLKQALEEQKELVIQLKQAREHAESANKNKSMFLANVSHEIRTPLTAILGFTDLLKDGPITENERIQFVETINRNGNALTKIINDVLDLSKVEANCLELEKIEVSPQLLLQDVVLQFEAKARNKNIYLNLEIQNELPHSILSDSVRIQQVLSNLLSNAIKFTDKGGVVVQVKSDIKQSIAEIQIRVVDTGIGLTTEQKEKLFQPFAQAEISTTRKFGGTGLGLALSKHLSEALGGALIIEQSQKDVGSTFMFSLCADIPERSVVKLEPKIVTHQMHFTPLSGFSILLAEDSLDNQYFIEKFLSKHGAQISVASNGKDVLHLCKKQEFDIILMDIEMPEMDGYEATRILRKQGYKNPILALTAHAMIEERSKTREAGCDGHLTKPIDTIQLLSALENQLANAKKKRR